MVLGACAEYQCMRQSARPLLSIREFLVWESQQETKFEFTAGRPIAMAGATTEHAHVVGNLFALLKPHVRRGCRIYTNDVKLITPRASVRYPDLLVTCDPRDRRSTIAQRHPLLVAEVLSESTAGTDRLEKLGEYKSIPELSEYVLADSRSPVVTLHRRGPGRSWLSEEFTTGDTVLLTSLDVEIAVDALYDDVVFPRKRSTARVP